MEENENILKIVDSYVDAFKEEIRGRLNKETIEKYFNYYMEKDEFGIIPSILIDVCKENELKFLEEMAKEKLGNEKAMEVLLGIYEKTNEREKYVDVATRLIQLQYQRDRFFDDEIMEKLIDMDTEKSIELLKNFKTKQAMKYLILSYEKEGNMDEALKIYMELLKEGIYSDISPKLKEYSKEKGKWDEIKNGIISILRKGGWYNEIIKFALEEGDIETMMAYLHRCNNAHLLEKVSKFIDEKNDMVSLKRLIEILIDRGGRENYKLAVNYMVKLKEKWLAGGENEKWNSYTNYIRKRYRKKYGLILEMEKRLY